ncbi:hypothetical protein [Loktanella sp. M215]|uniref:hypothetical protein n=1 Tax=Loktanella sp. M215 TaxID=2675431 RepID=UPI001F46A8BC|nr:hypothetical protein [Loktanella sp. M215]MCF7700733.1 hypothetical protein [Loktanella sp. M215]
MPSALLVSFAGDGPAIAPNNRIVINQGNPIIGATGNTLVVDKNAASNSMVAVAEPDQAV